MNASWYINSETEQFWELVNLKIKLVLIYVSFDCIFIINLAVRNHT